MAVLTRVTSNLANVIVGTESGANGTAAISIVIDHSERIIDAITKLGDIVLTLGAISNTQNTISSTLTSLSSNLEIIAKTHQAISETTNTLSDTHITLSGDIANVYLLANTTGIHVITPWEWLGVASLADYYNTSNISVPGLDLGVLAGLVSLKAQAETILEPYFDPDINN